MRQKRIKKTHGINLPDVSQKISKLYIKAFIKASLVQVGLVPGVDFYVTYNYLKIRHLKNITGKILVTLKEVFPVFNFYWETPRILVWF